MPVTPPEPNPNADLSVSERAVDELIGEMLTWDALGLPGDVDLDDVDALTETDPDSDD